MKKQTTLIDGNPAKCIICFAIPIFLGNLFQLFYSLVDMKIVGSIMGETALASVGAVSVLQNLITGFLNGLTLGFSVILARHYGSGDNRQIKKAVGNIIILGAGITVVLTVGISLALSKILHFLNVPTEQYALSYEYIRILMWCMLVTLGYNCCANMLRAIGDAVTPLLFLILATTLNIGLDYLFILGFHMGVGGAAWATVLAQLISVILCINRIRCSFPILHIRKTDLQPEGKMAGQMLQSGFSMALMSSLVNLGTLVLQTAINTLGTAVIIAHTAARKVFEMWNLPVSVLGSAMATYSGQNYGARRYDRIRKGLLSAILMGSCWSVMVVLMAHTVGRYLIGFIASTQNEEVLYWGSQYLKFDMSFHILCLLICTLRNSMQGYGDHVTPLVSSGIELLGKIIFASIFVGHFGYWAIIWTEPVIWILMLIPLVVMTLRNPVINGKSFTTREE